MTSPSRQVALVSGGTKGIGRATCDSLVQAGVLVAIGYNSDKQAADEIIGIIGRGKALAIQADASTVKGARYLVEETVRHFGRLDIIIATAGFTPFHDLVSTTEEEFDAAFALNVKGPYFLAQTAVPYLSHGSHIIFISSSLCTSSNVHPSHLLYCSSKGAVEQMTRVLSKDLARKGILVNAVAPGPTDTGNFARGKSVTAMENLARASPFGRIAEPREVAQVIAFLCTKGSSWISGQVIRVDGGAT